MIFHQPRFPWNFCGFPFLRHLLGAHVVWGRYKGHPSPNLSNFWWCQGASSLPRKWFRGNSTVTWRLNDLNLHITFFHTHKHKTYWKYHKHLKLQQTLTGSQPLSWQNNSSSTHDFNLWIFTPRPRHRAPVLLPALPAPQQQALPVVPIPPCLRPPRWVPTSAGHDVAPSEMPSRVFSSNIVFVGTRCARLFIFPPFRRMGGHTWHVACFCCLTVFRWIWSRLAEEWCRFFLVVSSQVVFFLVLDLNHQILHWNTPCFTNIRIASSIWMNPSLCVCHPHATSLPLDRGRITWT